MKKCRYIKMINIIICICFFFSCANVTDRMKSTKESIEYLSPVSLVADNNCTTVYIAEATAHKVSVFDISANRVKEVISLKKNPSGLVLSPDESRLYVTSGSSDGIIEIIDLNKNKVIKTISAGHTPCSPVISPDGKKLYVCNRFDNYVSVIDIAGKKEVTKIPMMREPICADITPDGKYLLVANHLPTNRQIDEYVIDGGYMDIKGYSYDSKYTLQSVVLIVDTETYRIVAGIQLPKGATVLKGICISPDGFHAYVTHILAHYLLPTEKIEHGSINTNALSVIDVTKQKLINTVLLDDINLGAANPWGVACSPDGDFICVAHAGTHEISIIDRRRLHAKLDSKAFSKTASDTSTIAVVPDDFKVLEGLRRRVHLKGKGPRGITVAGTKVYAAEYFTDSLGMADIYSAENQAVQSVALGTNQPLTPARKGEMYFNDADICFQKWQSCASCHPDGRNDGLNWDLLNDGSGNPKNTKSLLLSHKTPPSMITGVRLKAEDAVRAGIQHILFMDGHEKDAVAIDAYLKSLEKVPSPYLVRGKLSKEAKRGRKIFKKSGCIQCHPAPLYTDLRKYNAGTGSGKENNREFDTPTLIEQWRTAPYLYDGRADTMYKVLTDFNRRDKHGATSQLTLYEINNLIEFILSL